jgi:large subunit ribosomal protein L1
MTTKENFEKAIKELRKTEKKRNFDQSVDLIINLKNFDVRRESFNIFINLPHKVKDKKIVGFFEKDSSLIDTIKKDDFVKYKEKKDIKKLVKRYDAFISNAKLMPAVATAFGRVLGPAGKMPSPQLGILPNEDEKVIKLLIAKINSTVRVIVKEPSIKISIGKESLNDEQLVENAVAAYNKILETLPKKNENIRNVKIKLTMDKPVLIGV